MAVVSVDGICVIDGKPASYESNGFLIPAQGTTSVPGWMLNREQAAEFVFGSKKHSYAAESGSDTSNVGVIGVAWFLKKSPSTLGNPFHFMEPLTFINLARVCCEPLGQ
jgi:hypothetical protein